MLHVYLVSISVVCEMAIRTSIHACRNFSLLSKSRIYLPARSQSNVFGRRSNSTYNVLVVGGAAVGIAMTVTYWHQSRQKFDNVGLAGLHGQKRVEYEQEGAVHPEAVSEASLKNATDEITSIKPILSADKDKTKSLPDFVPYVLIGAGTASFAACKAIVEKDPSAKVLIIGEEEYAPYSRPPLSKQLWLHENHEEAKKLKFKASWSGGNLVDVFYKGDYCEPSDLMDKEEGGIAILTGRKAIHLDTRKKKIRLDNGFELSYNKCLIATGGKPKNLELFSGGSDELKKKTSTFRKIPDFKQLDDLLDRTSSILVVGGGFLGSELAVGLANRGRDKGVVITQMFPELGNLGLVLPEELSRWTTDKVRKEGVQVMTSTKLKEVDVRNNRVIAVTDDGKEVLADHVVIAVGIEPNTELSDSSRLEVDSVYGGFRVNAELQACTDVWVAGDVACYFDPCLGRRRVEHHDHANVTGRLAGQNMAGCNNNFDYQSMFWSDVGPEIGFEAVGIINSKLSTIGIFEKKSIENFEKAENEYSKGVIFYLNEHEKIVGVLTWNMFGKMEIARQILTEEKTKADIAELTSYFPIYD